jgi:hypothetical protein
MQCSSCRDTKLACEFSPSELKPKKGRSLSTKPSLRCLDCMAENKLKSRYNMTVEDYINMYEHQDGVCAICTKKPKQKDFYIDHDHVTGKVRALLCKHCNCALGFFRDDSILMNKAIHYINFFTSLKNN